MSEPVRPYRRGRRYWTEERIIAAFKRWASENDRQPDADDWRWSPRGYPNLATAQRAFGSWNAAVRAAGFEPRPIGHYDPRTREDA